MKTYTTITAIAGNTERKFHFIRAYSAKKPTYAGAARMVAAKINEDGGNSKPSEITVSRIEICDYQTR